MEFRRLLILYLSSQIVNFFVGYGLSYFIGREFSSTHNISNAIALVIIIYLYGIITLLNLTMFLTLIKVFEKYKINVFKGITVLNYLFYVICFLWLWAPIEKGGLIMIVFCLTGICTMLFVKDIYKKWVLKIS